MPGPPSMPLIRLVASLLMLLTLSIGLYAQEETPGEPEGATAVVGSIAIELDSFGVGGVVRPGEWAAVRVVLTDTVASQPRAVAVRLHVPDADGDTLLAERRVTLSPGRRLSATVYAAMPWVMPALFTITVHELADTSNDAGAVGRQLAAKRVAPTRVVEPDIGMIGVVGSRLYGLNQYELAMSPDARYGAQEWLDVVSGLTPVDLPDRYEGLKQFDVLVWGVADPTQLGLERPRAIEEWVRRGGHLVIVMPPVGGVWFTRDDPLRAIMPEVRAVRVEDVSYEPYRTLLTSTESDNVSLPTGATVHAFERPDTVDPMRGAPLIEGPHGVVVTRRLVGVGMVTVVGLDLADPQFVQRRIFRSDALWHRLLGKSFPIPFQAARRNGPTFQRPAPAQTFLDRHFAGSIENTAQAGVGILLAVVVFIAYWLVAGPLGFGILKANNWQRHAWVVFLGTIAAFAGIAWVGAKTLSETDVRAKHLTFLDHVYGQSFQRTRTFAGVMMPGYGDRVISIDGGAGDTGSDLLSVWSDPSGLGLITRFPDARSYTQSSLEPSRLRSPVRSTVKTVRAEYGGGVSWRTPRPVGPGFEPKLTEQNTLTGKLVHDLPGALTNVTMIVCYGQRDEEYGPDPDNVQLKNFGFMYPLFRKWEFASPWAPGVELDLGTFTTSNNARGGALYLSNLTPSAPSGVGMPFGGGSAVSNDSVSYNYSEARADAERLTWRPLLINPSYIDTRWERQRVTTRAGHGLDLARFMTMPCVIITGHMRTEDGPTPLREGSGEGDAIPMEGHTMVRWVYLLEPDPVRFGLPEDEE